MKKLWIKPGFELIFSLSLIAVMALPPLVFGQDKKDMDIRITNGDTVINGKNIRELSPAQRKQALNDIENLSGLNAAPVMRHRIFINKRMTADTGTRRITMDRFRYENGDSETTGRLPFKRDSAGRAFQFSIKRPDGADSAFAFTYRMRGGPESSMEDSEWGPNAMHRPRAEFMRHHRNTQSFDYNNTGTDGISTHVSFRVANPSPEKLKEMGGTEKNSLDIKDLNLVPEFSTGKTTLMFSLPSRVAAEVKLTDHDGKLIWSDKAPNGSFHKSFALGLNGIYFLQVKQAGKVAVKRIMKEE